jgi:hypothetical protein
LNTFGMCPKCGQTDGLINIRRERWYVCHQDETKWLVGTNLYSSLEELKQLHEATSPEDVVLLEGYAEVEPARPELRLVKE